MNNIDYDAIPFDTGYIPNRTPTQQTPQQTKPKTNRKSEAWLRIEAERMYKEYMRSVGGREGWLKMLQEQREEELRWQPYFSNPEPANIDGLTIGPADIAHAADLRAHSSDLVTIRKHSIPAGMQILPFYILDPRITKVNSWDPSQTEADTIGGARMIIGRPDGETQREFVWIEHPHRLIADLTNAAGVGYGAFFKKVIPNCDSWLHLWDILDLDASDVVDGEIWSRRDFYLD